ncbi:MAG: 30S ribosomal protein S16 [Reichenbachiella sp.]
MAVKIRLARRGRKKRAIYDVVVADARAPRDGRFIEKLGSFNPNIDPVTVNIDVDKAFDWVMKGALPTETARKLLSDKGVMLKKHLQIGVNKGAITQEAADKKYEAWLSEKEGTIQKSADDVQKAKDADKKARLEAEAKVNAARTEAIAAKKVVAEEAEAAANAEEASEEATEETPAAEATEAPVEEAPAKEESPAEPAAEVKEEAPAAEPVAEAKEEAPAEEKADEEKAAE